MMTILKEVNEADKEAGNKNYKLIHRRSDAAEGDVNWTQHFHPVFFHFGLMICKLYNDTVTCHRFHIFCKRILKSTEQIEFTSLDPHRCLWYFHLVANAVSVEVEVVDAV